MYRLNKYPDGTSYINGVTTKPIKFRINGYEDLWHLNQYVDAFISQFGFKPNVFIPNLLDAQADRRFHKGESSGLKLVLKFLKSLPVKQYQIFHPHNPEVVEAMLDNVEIIDNTKFVSNVLSNLGLRETIPSTTVTNGYVSDNLILMSSDAGGFKPLMKLCNDIGWKGETFSAAKARSWDEIDGTKFVQEIHRDDFNGKDVLIVDDICVYGGTFKGIANLFRGKNVGKLYLAVSHITIQNHKGDDTVFDYFDKVFTTNSKFDDYFVEDSKGEALVPKNLIIDYIV